MKTVTEQAERIGSGEKPYEWSNVVVSFEEAVEARDYVLNHMTEDDVSVGGEADLKTAVVCIALSTLDEPPHWVHEYFDARREWVFRNMPRTHADRKTSLYDPSSGNRLRVFKVFNGSLVSGGEA